MGEVPDLKFFYQLLELVEIAEAKETWPSGN